jgi:hypothetical protein
MRKFSRSPALSGYHGAATGPNVIRSCKRCYQSLAWRTLPHVGKRRGHDTCISSAAFSSDYTHNLADSLTTNEEIIDILGRS